jgi:hypothetical protein
MNKKARIRSSILVLAVLIAGALAVLRGQLSPQVATRSASAPAASTKASEEAAPTPGATPSASAAVNDTPNAETLEEMIRTGMSQLATQDDVRKAVTENPHGVPQELIRSGVLLGQIAEAVSKNPVLEARAVEFYSECATSSHLAHSIRALCLARHGHHSGKALSPELAAKVPESVQKLAGRAGL